jgi:hypothetical protein
VNKQEEVDADAGNAVEDPGPHSFTAPVEGASGNYALAPRSGNLYRDRHGGLLAG